MSYTTFDTLEYFEKLRDSGVLEAQAKVQVEGIQTAVKNYDMTSTFFVLDQILYCLSK